MLRTLDRKYDLFTNAVELQEKVRRAVGYHLLGSIRNESVTSDHLGDRLARLRGFIRQGHEVKISPTVPVCLHNSFRIEEVTETYVKFLKGGFAFVSIPAERIEEILETAKHEPPTVCLAGRLQFLTPHQNWYFFPEAPPLSDPLSIGLGRHVPTKFSFSEET